MKNSRVFLLVSIALFTGSFSLVLAQEEEKKPSPFTVSADIYSNYISIPVSGSVILNPEKEQLYVVAGLSF